MRLNRLLVCGFAAAWLLGVPAIAQAQEEEDRGNLLFTVFGGMQNGPGGFDVYRTVSYSAGKTFGGGIGIGLFRNLAVRGDFAYSLSSGQQSGAIVESVKLNRTYYSASLEFRVPTSMGIAPYALVGGGVVRLRRSAPSYNFDLTESGGVLGGGLAYDMRESRVSLFLQVTEWIYPRSSVGSTQYDTIVGAGVTFRL